MTKKNFLKQSKTTLAIGGLALISGFYFLNKQMTGSVISETQTKLTPLPLIGLLLIACSAVLIIYSIKKK